MKTAAEILAFVMGVLGILYLPRLANIAITTITILGLILFRRRSSIQIFRNLRSRSTSRAYLYALGFVALIAIIGSFSFIIGNKLGQTSAARSILKSLDLPAHPIPPPRPRFPGDVSLDEYCRSEGPYTVMAPTENGMFVQIEGEPPVYFSPLTEDQRRMIEADLGKDYLVCQSRIRRPDPSSSETDAVYFPVNRACEWQYPGQHVKAIPPRDRRYIDQWRCHLESGQPARWP